MTGLRNWIRLLTDAYKLNNAFSQSHRDVMFKTQSSDESVPTVLFLSPSVTAVAIITAQRRGLRMQDWLDKLVVGACSGAVGEKQEVGTMSDDMTIELFARVASHSPGLLTDRWHLLFERTVLDDSLWDYPTTTLEAMEADPNSTPSLNVERLRRKWPRLLATAFALLS